MKKIVNILLIIFILSCSLETTSKNVAINKEQVTTRQILAIPEGYTNVADKGTAFQWYTDNNNVANNAIDNNPLTVSVVPEKTGSFQHWLLTFDNMYPVEKVVINSINSLDTAVFRAYSTDQDKNPDLGYIYKETLSDPNKKYKNMSS